MKSQISWIMNHKVIKINQNPWLKPYIDRKKAKKDFKKFFFKLMNNAVFEKTMENMRRIEILNLLQQKE